MATISKHFADIIINNNGWYPGDPRAGRVIRYTDMGGKDAYAVEYPWERGRYDNSGYIHNAEVIWEAK